MSDSERYKNIKSFDKGRKMDISGDFARANKSWLQHFGNDESTYKAELFNASSVYWA